MHQMFQQALEVRHCFGWSTIYGYYSEIILQTRKSNCKKISAVVMLTSRLVQKSFVIKIPTFGFSVC